MENVLFSNSEKSNLFRYFRLGEDWPECFVVEFIIGEDHYEHLYWGNNSYVENDRAIISELLTITYLPDSMDKWKKEKLERFQSRIENIIKKAENEINALKNKRQP